MSVRLAVDRTRRKHMFESGLDFERAFVQHRGMQRTYVRRRLAVIAGFLLLVGMLGGPMGHAVMAGDRFGLVTSRTRVVREGDTLWSVASAIAPDRDPRDVIDEIEQLNPGVSSSLVQGQVLHIPASD
jgi:hypothetical protein